MYDHWQRQELALTRRPLLHIDTHFKWWAFQEVRLQEAHDLVKLNLLFPAKNSLQLIIQVNEASIIRIL